MHEAGYNNLIGLDPAPAMIAAARQKFPSLTFGVMDNYQHMDMPDASVDAVLLLSVLTCVPTDDGQLAIMSEITRVLRPHGVLYISDLWLQTDSRNMDRYARFEKKYGVYGVFDLREGVTVRHHEPAWIEMLTKGYEQLSLEVIAGETMNGNPATVFQWFGRKDIRNRTT
jgi:ubiquinone/menaquinone biosynthesis C-methylase UbiE